MLRHRLPASRMRPWPATLLLLALAACDAAKTVPEAGVTARLAGSRSTAISKLRYTLAVDLPRAPGADIEGRMRIDLELAEPAAPLQVDFREAPERLKAIRVNGRAAPVKHRAEHILIPTDALLAGANRLEFDFLVGDSSLNRNPDFLYTLFVPDRARTAFPVFDQPDLKAVWELTLALPADWRAISSAPLAAGETDGDRRILRFAPSERISTYHFSFVAGAFEAITRDVSGRPMTLLHRETDEAKIERNREEIFRLHEAALAWLEDYTGIPFPYEKLDIALLPAHPYGGMEHVGAIQYRAESLWLDEGASDTQRLRRATLIAHEVAHMWFGNLVTMRWFDDVWTKEVFANFMAAKIVNPAFPDINHELNFLIDHHPGAYAIDRTAGANAIRQPLANLNQAGQLYGPIIYDKAPIMMRQLERLVGEAAFRDGLREYLRRYAHGNASWPELIRILDARSGTDVAAWSEVWVNTPGRPQFAVTTNAGQRSLDQTDPADRGRLWPQSFAVLTLGDDGAATNSLRIEATSTALGALPPVKDAGLLLNADGFGYGLFPADAALLDARGDLAPLPLASLLIQLYEQMLETGDPSPPVYLHALLDIATATDDQLLLDLALGQLQRIFWTLIDEGERRNLAAALERRLWTAMEAQTDPSLRKLWFKSLAELALTAPTLSRLADIWSGNAVLDALPLAERDMIELARLLAIKDPAGAGRYVAAQLERTKNPDQRRRLAYLEPSLAPDRSRRDAFFASLADERARETEAWVLDALANLHHPLRVGEAQAYLPRTLELLEEIQATGDIFFPAGWLRVSLANHHSDRAVAMIETFLAERPDYNPQLRMKILQAADPVLRANRLRREARSGG